MEYNDEQEVPSQLKGNYVNFPTHEMLTGELRRIPRGLQLGIELKDDNGVIYGHSHTPIGFHCHQAAEKIEELQNYLKHYRKVIVNLGRSGIRPEILIEAGLEPENGNQ